MIGTATAARLGGITDSGFSLTGGPAAVAIGGTLFAGFLYFWLAEGSFGATLGKGIEWDPSAREGRPALRDEGRIDSQPPKDLRRRRRLSRRVSHRDFLEYTATSRRPCSGHGGSGKGDWESGSLPTGPDLVRGNFSRLSRSLSGSSLLKTAGGAFAPWNIAYRRRIRTPSHGWRVLLQLVRPTVGDLFERIRTSMPADRPGRISCEQNTDILAYILSMNHFPAGNSELSAMTEILKQIRLEASAPQAACVRSRRSGCGPGLLSLRLPKGEVIRVPGQCKFVVSAILCCSCALAQNTDLEHGRIEIRGSGGGIRAGNFHVSQPAFAAGVEAAIGLNRIVAVTGTYSFDRLYDRPDIFQSRVVHEFMGGFRFSIPNHSSTSLSVPAGQLRPWMPACTVTSQRSRHWPSGTDSRAPGKSAGLANQCQNLLLVRVFLLEGVLKSYIDDDVCHLDRLHFPVAQPTQIQVFDDVLEPTALLRGQVNNRWPLETWI